jgi:hypothetical protein
MNHVNWGSTKRIKLLFIPSAEKPGEIVDGDVISRLRLRGKMAKRQI